MNSNNNIVWQPSKQQIEHSNMTQFTRFVEQHHSLKFTDYPQLYQWSIENAADFWQSVWQFCGIKSSQTATTVLQNSDNMLQAKWFVNAKLNFAENLLSRRDTKPAIIFHTETNQRRELSYQELYAQVAATAAALKKLGIKANDCVAGYLPNMPETIIAMLATASIGAIWSSCSPDFGVQGVVDRFSQISPKVLFATDGQFYNGKTHSTLAKIADITQQVDSIERVIVIPFIDNNPDISQLVNAQLYSDFAVETAAVLEFAQLPFDHPLYVLYSSGTTGQPKCIVHGAGGTLLQHLKELMLHTNLSANDTIFYYTTCGWMMWNWVVSSLALGATLVLFDGAPTYPKEESLFDLISQEQVNIFDTSAKYLSALEKAEVSPISTHDLTCLRTILSTGSPLSPASYDYVYQHIKPEVQLASISGGTDIVSCFALGNPNLPVYRGELQCRGLGMAVEIFDEDGNSIIGQKGELVCTKPFPCMPIYFWNDASGEKYRAAYFTKYPNIWAHGDFAELTEHHGLIIYGRSDTILNPGGVRIGTAEIYRQVEKVEEVLDSIVVGQDWQDDVRVILFVKLRPGLNLDEALLTKIKQQIRQSTTPRHVPAKILQVSDIPRTVSGKIVELAVRNAIHGLPIKNKEALANPEALEQFMKRQELRD